MASIYVVGGSGGVASISVVGGSGGMAAILSGGVGLRFAFALPTHSLSLVCCFKSDMLCGVAFDGNIASRDVIVFGHIASRDVSVFVVLPLVECVLTLDFRMRRF